MLMGSAVLTKWHCPTFQKWRLVLEELVVRRPNKFLLAMLLPALLFLLLTRVLPLFYSVQLSFFHYQLTDPSATRFIGGENYSDLLQDPDFWDSIQTTLIYTFGVLIVELVAGLAIANLLDRKMRLKNVVIAIMIAPMIVTPVVAGILWRIIFHTDYGIVNNWLRLAGIIAYADSILWLSDAKLALPTVMFVDIWQWTPFVALILLAGLESLPKAPFESAMIDGANPWQIFTRIKLPLLKPFIGAALVLRFMDAFKVFDTIWVMTGGGPGRATEVVSLTAVKTAFRYFKFGQGGAIVVVLLLMLMFGSFAFIRIFRVWHQES
jgi:multiple sugar transport system permease protein